MLMSDVIEHPSFSVTPHRAGPVLVVLCEGTVIANVRLDPPTQWALSRALRDASAAQCEYEQRAVRFRDDSR